MGSDLLAVNTRNQWSLASHHTHTFTCAHTASLTVKMLFSFIQSAKKGAFNLINENGRARRGLRWATRTFSDCCLDTWQSKVLPGLMCVTNYRYWRQFLSAIKTNTSPFLKKIKKPAPLSCWALEEIIDTMLWNAGNSYSLPTSTSKSHHLMPDILSTLQSHNCFCIDFFLSPATMKGQCVMFVCLLAKYSLNQRMDFNEILRK